MMIMKIDIPDVVLKDIALFAENNSVDKVVLFGSRARGTNTERSDVDLDVYGAICGKAIYSGTLDLKQAIEVTRNMRNEL